MITGAGSGPDSPIDSRIGLGARAAAAWWFEGWLGAEERPKVLTALSIWAVVVGVMGEEGDIEGEALLPS